MIVSVVAQDLTGGLPTTDDAGLWADGLELTYPVVADVNGTFWDEWNPTGVLPIAYIVDQQGVIAYARAGGGAAALAELEDTIDTLLESP